MNWMSEQVNACGCASAPAAVEVPDCLTTFKHAAKASWIATCTYVHCSLKVLQGGKHHSGKHQSGKHQSAKELESSLHDAILQSKGHQRQSIISTLAPSFNSLLFKHCLMFIVAHVIITHVITTGDTSCWFMITTCCFIWLQLELCILTVA